MSSTTRPRVPTRVVELARWSPAILLPLLLLTIPLEFTALWFPYQIIEVGRLVMVAIVLALVILALAGHQVQLPARGLWLPPLVFIGYALISAAVTRSSPGLKTGAAALTYGLVALAIYNWSRRPRIQDSLWMWFAVSCIGLSVIGIIQRITGGYIWREPTAGLARVNATFADPNVLGRVLTCMIVVGIALAPSMAGRRTRAIMIAAVVLSSATLPFTYSREAWLIGGLAVALAIVTSRRPREAIPIAAAAIAVFGSVTLFVPEVQSRFGTLRHGLSSGASHHIFNTAGLGFLNYIPALDSERHYLLAAGLQMFYNHPLFGLGFGRFPSEMLGPYNGFILSGYTTIDSHTSLVTILAELGLVGLAFAVWWLVAYIRQSAVSIRREQATRAYVIAPLLAVIVILLASQLQGRLVDEPYLWVFLGLAWAAMAFEASPDMRTSQPAATTSTPATSQNSTARSFFQ